MVKLLKNKVVAAKLIILGKCKKKKPIQRENTPDCYEHFLSVLFFLLLFGRSE